MNLKGCFSHKSDDWRTPDFIYSYFMRRGYFDPCPLNPNGLDGLFIDWKEKNFVNPPYSDILRFVEKALFEADSGKRVVMLLPVRTDVKWFRLLSNYGCFIEFFIGRLKFNGSKSGAPFPSMLVWLEKGCNKCVVISPKVYEETAHGVPPRGCPSRMRRVGSSERRPLDYGDAGPMK